ncbi:MAG: phage portal protein [Lachnospiraceae bacterium]|nr:phage portal protein [Lachnospiraceae bacterium]
MGFFGRLKNKIMATLSRWREIGEYRSTFRAFGTEAYRSEVVRSCIRPLAEFTSKANARCNVKQIEMMLNDRPNIYMNGKEFLYKIRTLYELRNNVFIYIDRDEKGKPKAFMPVVYSSFEAMEYGGNLFIQFSFQTGEKVTLPWDDLAVIRKDYSDSNFVGDDNSAILETLELISTTNQGIANAVKATANLRGILKSTKAMLSPEDIKRNKEEFVKDYLQLENEGGIAALDATQEFTPISMSPVVATYTQMKEFRENVQRYFGVNDKIIMCSLSSDELQTFYEMRIEPFLTDLSTELTSKCFTAREKSFDNWIMFESNRLQFASLDKKIQMFATVVQYGGMTINEWRAACNMAPIDGGDDLIRRLDAAKVDDPAEGEE